LSRPALSAVVIAQDNADTIGRCVRSLSFADEVVVVDAGSDDGTPEIAREAGARVVTNPWPGFAAQRRFAIEQATGDWVLSVDSDEEVSEELAREIPAAIASAGAVCGFWLPRRNQFLGRWMDHGPWSGDRVLRLFRRDRGAVTDRRVHEGIDVDGETAALSAPILHYAHRTIGESVRRLDRYTTLEARDRAGRRRIRIVDVFVPPAGVFVKYYLVKGSWRDGVHGLVLSAITAMYKSVLYVKIYLLQREEAFDTPPSNS